MESNTKSRGYVFREILFQLLLHVTVLICYAVSRRNPQIEAWEFWYFAFYAAVTLLVNYWLLPRFFYRKRYVPFSVGLIALIGFVIFFEEMALEQWFFPDTRALQFPGLLYSLISVLPVMVTLTGFKFAWDAMVKQGEVEVLTAAVEESELQFLKSQINPHFLFNNLNNLYAYALEGSPKTPRIILELSSLLRYMLYECKEDFVLLAKEIDQLRHFCQLNELQIEERGRISFAIEGRQAGYRIAPLILIVFIENAFKHSQASLSKDIEIDIKINIDERGQLDFYCTNNFGIQVNNDKLSKGIGLDNVRKRLALLYPKAHRLHIEETKSAYRVHLRLQLAELKSL